MKSNLLEETNLLKNFNFIKAILMILVIFGHSIDFWSGNWFTCNPIIPSMFLNVLQKWINSFHIYAFTIISGFIFAFLMKKKHYNCFKKFLNNKVRRLLIPYFFAALLWVMPISQLFYHLNIFEIIEKYLLCIDPAQLWFLWMLFWCFVIHWFLYPYISKNIFYGLSISIICFCIGFVGIRTIDNIFCIFTSLMYIPFFIFGIYLYEIKDFRYIFSKIPFFFIFIVNIFAFCLYLYFGTFDDVIMQLFTLVVKIILNFTGSIFIIFFLNYLLSQFKFLYSLLIDMSKYSMCMYLFHQQLIYFTITMFNGKVSPIINVLINFMFSFVISYILSKILFRFSLTRVLIGEKK